MTEQDTNIVLHSIFSLTDSQLSRLHMLSEMCAKSQLAYGKMGNAGDLFLIMLKGMEIGIEPMASLDLISLIQGKPTLSPQGMIAQIYNSPYLENIAVDSQATSCTVSMKRVGMDTHTETFTMQDAAAQQLTGKANWKKMPAIMLKWRAVAACARVVFPDVIQGVYTQEELGADVDYTDDGVIVEFPEEMAEPPGYFPTEDDAPPQETPQAAPQAPVTPRDDGKPIDRLTKDVNTLSGALEQVFTDNLVRVDDGGEMMNYVDARRYADQLLQDGWAAIENPLLYDLITAIYNRAADKLAMDSQEVAYKLGCAIEEWIEKPTDNGLSLAWDTLLKAYHEQDNAAANGVTLDEPGRGSTDG